MITDKYSKGCLTRYQTMTVFFILVGIHSTGYILYGLNFYLLMPERFECLKDHWFECEKSYICESGVEYRAVDNNNWIT